MESRARWAGASWGATEGGAEATAAGVSTGGGFIAGLVTGTAIILQYVAYGSEWARERLPWSYSNVVAVGLLVATLTGLGSWVFGAPFLTSTFGYVTWPVVGKFELASAMAFDLGIYLAVVGVVLVIIGRLGGLSGPEAGTAGPGDQ